MQKESYQNGDLLQGSFLDSYQNLVTKTREILKWYLHNCYHVQYLLKTDDDMYINVRNAYDLATSNDRQDLLTGFLACDNAPNRLPSCLHVYVCSW